MADYKMDQPMENIIWSVNTKLLLTKTAKNKQSIMPAAQSLTEDMAEEPGGRTSEAESKKSKPSTKSKMSTDAKLRTTTTLVASKNSKTTISTFPEELVKINTSLEKKHPTNVMIYGNSDQYERLAAIIDKHKDLWVNKGGFVDIPEDEWMEVPLKSNFEDLSKDRVKVYPFGHKDREVIDKEFNKLHNQKRMK